MLSEVTQEGDKGSRHVPGQGWVGGWTWSFWSLSSSAPLAFLHSHTHEKHLQSWLDISKNHLEQSSKYLASSIRNHPFFSKKEQFAPSLFPLLLEKKVPSYLPHPETSGDCNRTFSCLLIGSCFVHNSSKTAVTGYCANPAAMCVRTKSRW